MNGVVFMETLRRNWRTALYWGIGIGAYAMYVLMVFGADDSTRAQMAELMATKLPGVIGQMFGIPDDAEFLASTQGFLGFAFFVYASLMLSVWGVLNGLAVTANDEESGVMNMLLALPIPRWRVAIERIAANLVMLVEIGLFGLVGLFIGLQASASVEDVQFGSLIAGMTGVIMVVAVVMAVTALLAVLVKRRGLAAGLAGVFVAASFLLNTLGGAAQGSIGTTLQQLSVFHHFDASEVLKNGLTVGSVVILLATLAIVSWGGVQLFQRRDIGG